jgi:cellulose synthase/poly-beta-1,6-N-acetylglucosamine synthase-like glycosyltransferase
VIAYGLGLLTIKYDILSQAWGEAVLLAQIVVATVVFYLIVRRIVESKPKNIDAYLSDRELPTVSVLIPARNEDENLVEALK